jgi:glycosyltransferase involved in cell wall biosynthesis
MSQPGCHLRVLIVAEHASARFGGEAVLPLHYFRFLRRRGIEAWLIVHARTRDELAALMPEEMERIEFVPDTWFHKSAVRLGRPLPSRLSSFTLGYAMRLDCQLKARRIARRLIAQHAIDVVHQPIPVSPREPSVLYGLGVPVIIGSMNGGMSYPPAFSREDGRLTAAWTALGRGAASTLNRLMPGKRQAAALLVSNERTRRALPPGLRGEVIDLVENGVDLAVWTAPGRARVDNGVPRFIFVGRLIDWKAVDILLDAFARAVAKAPMTLDLLGDGSMRPSLEARAAALGITGSVRFHGWMLQHDCAVKVRESDVLVLPSLYECGGAVVLEAMASRLPVIATNWGGPTDYVNESCGILVDPTSRDALVGGFAEAMLQLASSPALREAMGRAGRERIENEFDWEHKIDRILEIYARFAGSRSKSHVDPAPALSRRDGGGEL